jgi:hypothetical protein
MSLEQDEAIRQIDKIVQQSERGLFGAGAARTKVKQVLEDLQNQMHEDSYRVRCDAVHEMWGPHEGCREFMTEPEAIVRCDGPVTHYAVIEHGSPSGAYVEAENLCEQHYAERLIPFNAGSASNMERLIGFGRVE